jgi:hypothetical protein
MNKINKYRIIKLDNYLWNNQNHNKIPKFIINKKIYNMIQK